VKSWVRDICYKLSISLSRSTHFLQQVFQVCTSKM